MGRVATLERTLGAMPLLYEPFDPARDLDEAVRILCYAFAGEPDGVKDWISNAGFANLRVVRDGAAPVATLLRVPMGQFFGGRSVPMVGVAGVGVSPVARGRGVARTLMTESLREMRRDGVPISALYPATSTLYRRVGYEYAGLHLEHRLPVSRFRPARDTQPVRPFTQSDLPALKACYTATAMPCDGALDRGDYIWNRVFNPRSGPCAGFVIDELSPDACGPDGIGAYVFFRQERDPVMGRHDIECSDLVAASPRAARQLLGFLGEFGSMANDLVIRAGAIHPLFALCDEPRGLRTIFREYWMLRIVDLAAALTARGYSSWLSTSLDLDVRDETLPENAGRWRLRVEGGRGTVERGGDGTLRCDIRGLASMYAGFMTPRAHAVLGLVEGNDPALAVAAAVFGSNSAGFCDFF